MAAYAIEINERSIWGKRLVSYLSSLPIKMVSIPKSRVRKSRFEQSQEDIKHGRVTSFDSADEMCKALGI